MHFGARIWNSSLSCLQVYCSLPEELMLFLSCKTSHVALSQAFLAKGWMRLSDTLGGPHSNTHVYQEEKIILRTWGRWMELWASSSPQFHKFLDHFLSNYVGVRSDHWFSSLLFDQGYFSLSYYSLLDLFVSLSFLWVFFVWVCLPRVPWSNLRLPVTKVLKILFHLFLLFRAHFVITYQVLLPNWAFLGSPTIHAKQHLLREKWILKHRSSLWCPLAVFQSCWMSA